MGEYRVCPFLLQSQVLGGLSVMFALLKLSIYSNILSAELAWKPSTSGKL